MGLEMKYFVLKPRAKARDDVCARASQMAMNTYAAYLRTRGAESLLADDLLAWSNSEHIRQLAQPTAESEQPDEPG